MDRFEQKSIASSGVAPAVGWNVLRTRPQHEKVVAEQLGFKSIEAFLPASTTRSCWKDRTVFIERPLFPGYVFVRASRISRNQMLSVPGVINMLCFNGAPAAVEDAEIDAVRLCVHAGQDLEPHPFLPIGELVLVTSGALAGLRGVVVRHKNRCRIVVSIALLHQSMSVEIDSGLLTPLGHESGDRPHTLSEDSRNALTSNNEFKQRTSLPFSMHSLRSAKEQAWQRLNP